jgi:predicted GH43/DUF377 family glycosyl hydrolase
MSFVTKIEKEFPDLTLIHLEDGRVVGINSECIVVYTSIDDVYEGETMDRPTITLNK